MDEDGLSPQRIATACGVSPDTIRYYEGRGVIPRATRSENGYRRFPAGTVARVMVVRRALAVGFTIDELARVFKERARGAPPCREVRALFGRKLAEIDQRIEDLGKTRTAMAEIVASWDARLAHTPPGAPAHLLDRLPALAAPTVETPLRRRRTR
jgi:DNA-binding transcriptional MerR regulator